MDIERRDRRPWLLLVLGFGLTMGLQIGLMHLVLWRSWTAFIGFMSGSVLFSCTAWGLIRFVFPRVDAPTLAGQVWRQGLVAAVILLPLSVFYTDFSARYLLDAPGVFGPPVGGPRVFYVTPEMRQGVTRLYAVVTLLPTIIVTLLGYHVVRYQVRRMQERERELTELAATAQLAALRAQINPHFLFNSLNSIAQLIRTDPEKAEACVERLAQMFRYILHRAEQEFVPLAEELEMTHAYLDIERARFADRLAVETDIDPASLRHPIPNLVLQPLVENAIKHGLSRKIGRGTVSIGAALRDGTLTITVADDGLGIPPRQIDDVWRRGVGLRNLRERIERLYGPGHVPEISSAPGSGTVVRLTLPVPPAEAA